VHRACPPVHQFATQEPSPTEPKLILPETPAIDRLDVKAPVAAKFESWQLPAFELAVNGRRVNFEVVGKFLHGHYSAVIGFHVAHGLPAFFECPLMDYDSLNTSCVPRAQSHPKRAYPCDGARSCHYLSANKLTNGTMLAATTRSWQGTSDYHRVLLRTGEISRFFENSRYLPGTL